MSVVDINHQTDFSGSILIEARQLRPLVDMARQAGVGIGPILADLGLPADLWASRPDAMAPLAIYYRLRNLLSAAMGDETCKLSSRPLMPGSADFILSHLDGAKTLKDAMKQVADYYNLLHGGEYNSVRRRGDAVLLVTDDRDFPYRRRDDLEHVRFAMECVQIYLYGTLSMLAPSAVTGLKSVAVTRPRGGGLGAGQLGFWTAPVRYGASVYALEFDSEAALAPIVLPPAEMLTAREVYEHVLDMVEARGR
ncbi:MAG TPA: AraC family transcriptional regulator ligand-binding domain-containing protein, partial [Parvularculaceae bacterium]|nr:AraC family transcriptional regulator ligand-binding domain-containing protein [Parvularculaceae bacterium]